MATHDRLTDLNLAAIRQRAEMSAVATNYLSTHDPRYFSAVEIRDSANDVPALLAEVERLRAALRTAPGEDGA